MPTKQLVEVIGDQQFFRVINTPKLPKHSKATKIVEEIESRDTHKMEAKLRVCKRCMHNIERDGKKE